jgi:hypothetical protein
MTKEPEFKYLAIRNWNKYQAGVDRKGRQIKAWVKDYTGKDVDDPQYSKMTMSHRYLFDAFCRLRARVGHNLLNDPSWISGALFVIPRERSRVTIAIRSLISRGFLTLTNKQFDAPEPETQPEPETETETQVPPPPDGEAAVSPLPSGEQIKTSTGSGSLAGQDQKPTQHRKPCACADRLCDWSDPLVDCSLPLSRIADAVYYQRHVKKNDYFIPRLTKAYVRREWKRLVADTPEDYRYDPDPLFEVVEKHLNGIDEPPVKQTFLRRKPRTLVERQSVRAKFPHMPTDVIEALYDPNCKHGCEMGSLFVSDFPDATLPIQRRLGHGELCSCVLEDSDE